MCLHMSLFPRTLTLTPPPPNRISHTNPNPNLPGLSNSIMKAVTDREVVDKYIVGGGVAVVTLVVFLLVYYR